MEKVIVEIGFVLVRVFKFVIYLIWFCCNVEIMVNVFIVIDV